MSSVVRSPGLGELLRHLQDLVDGSSSNHYQGLSFAYRPRYTPIMRELSHGPATVGELRQRLALTQGAVSQTVKLMMGDGLIERRRGADGRQTVLRLSGHGAAVLPQLQRHWDSIFRAIDDLERQVGIPLMDCLTKAVHALEASSLAQRMEAGSSPSDGQRASGGNPFTEAGAGYAAFRPAYDPAMARDLAQLVPNAAVAIDMGCGNGQLSLVLAEFFNEVIGFDPSETQIAHALAQREAVSFRQGNAENIDLSDDSADLMVAAQAAHWFDLQPFFVEAQRVVRDGGAVALITYGVPYVSHPVNALLQQTYWGPLHDFWPAERAHVESGYTRLPFPFSELPFPEHSCRALMAVEDLIGYMRTWSAYRAAWDQGLVSQFDRAFDALRAAWPAGESLEIVWPLAARVGRIHKGAVREE